MADTPAEARELAPAELYQRCDPDSLGFALTSELAELPGPLGQQRAMDALQFGVGMRHEGYNLYVMGPPGTGRHALVRQLLERAEPAGGEVADWCFVNNFDAPHRPRALRLPPGHGKQLQCAMRQMGRGLLGSLPAAFDSDAYRSQVQQLDAEFKAREEEAFAEVREEAEARNIAVLQTPMGYTMAPARRGSVIDPAEFEALPDKDKQRIEQDTKVVRERLTAMLREGMAWQKEHAQRKEELDESVARKVAEQSMAPLREQYGDNAELQDWFGKVQADIVERGDDIRQFAAENKRLPANGDHPTPFTHYDVNVLVDNGGLRGTPVVYEDHPSYQNLMGRVDHIAQFGTLLTNFTLIKAGALHRANGGHLILDARKLLMQPFVWDALKRALFARELRIESVERMLSLASTITLEPEPIPLSLKVVLIGERLLYYLLSAYDPDFDRLFKVQADFAEDVERTAENTQLYARLIATQLQRERLLPASADAVARLIEQAARKAEDGRKLSLRTEDMLDLQRESDHYARAAKADRIEREHVERAVNARRERASRVQERMQETMVTGIRMIDTQGSRVAQINGLAVMQLGGQAFGHPSRITATARVGDGKVVDIEREVKLGEAIHSKGVLILTAYLAQRYAHNAPLSLSASLVFEQSYGPIDGDSASVAELCALLSALGGMPLRQDLAVTGSVNQHGQVQAIGGVNEKIEGFFELCQARGLDGSQGVVIPQANARHLMLRSEVTEAVAAGRFHIHVATEVDQVISLLTGLPAGTADADGNFAPATCNGRVQLRLRELGQRRQAFAHPGCDEEPAQ